jgi:uncharacterized protein (TIGR03437 family)
MDAAHTYFSKTVLFLATALLTVVPGLAQPSFNLNSSNSNAITVSPTSSTAAVVYVAGTTDASNNPITFTESAPSYASGDPVWLSESGSGFTTPTFLYFGIGGVAQQLQPGPHSATVTLTATNQSGVTPAVITITYYANSASSGGGTVSPSLTAVTLSAVSGASTSTSVNLTTTSPSLISFNATSATTSGGGWLTATANTYTVSNANYAILTIGAPNGIVLGNGTYYGTVTITPTSGGQSSTINVTFTVGSGVGTGNLTASPGSLSWSYTTGSGVYPSAQVVTLSSATGAATYTASVSSSSAWLYANGTSSTSGYISSGVTISPGATFSTLTTGSYTGYVYVQDGNGNQVTITVNLSVNGGTTNGITLSPNPVTLTAAVGGTTVSQVVSVSYISAGSITSASTTGTGLFYYVYTSTLPGSVTVYGNPSGLSAGTYNGSLTVTVAPTGGTAVSTTIAVSFVVGSGSVPTTPGIVTPTSLTFAYQTGTTVSATTLPSQNIVISGTAVFAVSAPTYASGQPTGWLTTSATSGTAPGTISVSITNPGTLAAGTYTATFAVTPSGGSATTVSVSFLVAPGPVLVAYPGSLNFTYTPGLAIPYSPLYLNASDNSAMPVSATTSATWLSVSAPTQPNTSTVVSVNGNNVSSLANGVYTATITVTATGAANSPVNVPVVLTVTGSTATGGGSLTLSNSSLTFSAQQGGTAPALQTLSVYASSLTYYTATPSSAGNWLIISPSGSLNTSSNPSLAVTVNQSGLTANTYYGSIALVANGVTQTVQVTLVVSTSTITSGSGNVTVTANSTSGTPSLAFIYQMGGNAPAVQTLQVSSASGSAPVSFTIASSATWLSAGVQNGTSLNTPAGFTVAIVNPSSLAAGAYTANITITPTGGTVVTIPVSLTVQAAPTVSVTSATTLSFSYQAGSASPTPATVSVSGGGQSLGFTAQVTSGSNWLSISPTSGTTPTTGTAALTVTATPGTLAAGSYTGTILVSATGTATGSTSINVTLTVTAPLPTINSVVNAASFIKGAVSPGEIVTLFGTAMGPSNAAYATIDPSTGKLATTIGGVQVLFNGILAPMIYATATQISAVVPYEIAPISSPSVWVKYVGQTSNAYPLNSATTMPGVFTQNSSGSGPGAILNQNSSLNGPNNPAAKGSIVQLFMTGEGQTSPPSVTGAITTATLLPPQVTPAPLLAVGVLIDGYPASWTYAGEAPGLAAGLMQLNVQIPPSAPSGSLPIQVSIGGNFSQTGVTVSVQ